MKTLFLAALISLSQAVPAIACSTHGKTVSRESLKPARRKPAQANIPRFPQNGSLESALANLLLDNPAAVLSVPARLLKSDYHPFGDGQSNSKLAHGESWSQAGFPAVGKLVAGKRSYDFHPSLKISKFKEEDLGQGRFRVTPEGWQDSFYFNFDTAALKITDFLQGVPAPLRTFTGGRTAPDLEKIGSQSAFDALRKKKMGAGFNSDPWFSESVHGRFPHEKGELTATGGVYTWGIVDKAFGPFKNLYTCFEARDLAKEKNTGVPSGAGWHLIGDSAESILNNLDQASIPVATGRTHGQANAAYGLSESLTATWLKAGEVLVSRQGDFHWYVNPLEREVCTEIWVHNCVPDAGNNWGMKCGG